jgi:hypothetical protein
MGRHRPVHCDQQRIAWRAADVFALQSDGCWQYDIGVPRGRGPCGFMHDDGIRPRKGVAQPVQILMVVEGVAARPIDQPDLGVGKALAVEVERLTRMEQHVGNARHRDEIGNAVALDRQCRKRHGQWRLSGIGGRSQRIGETATRQSDLAEHRRQHDAHPDRLLAVLGALQRLGAGDQSAPAGGAARQPNNFIGGHAANSGRPAGILRLTVISAEQVALKDLVTDAVSIEKSVVVQAFRYQRVRDAEHQRYVRAGADRVPDRPGLGRQIVVKRAD